jgi:hypothetical protein
MQHTAPALIIAPPLPSAGDDAMARRDREVVGWLTGWQWWL